MALLAGKSPTREGPGYATVSSALYLCIAKQLFITSSLVLKAHIVLNISDVVLQTDSFTVKSECPSTLSTLLSKN